MRCTQDLVVQGVGHTLKSSGIKQRWPMELSRCTGGCHPNVLVERFLALGKNLVFVLRKSRRVEVIVTRLRVGHTSLTHGFLLRGDPPPVCEFCDAPLSVYQTSLLIEALNSTIGRLFGCKEKKIFLKADNYVVLNILKDDAIFRGLPAVLIQDATYKHQKMWSATVLTIFGDKDGSGRKIGTFMHPLAVMTSLLAMLHAKVVMPSIVWGSTSEKRSEQASKGSGSCLSQTIGAVFNAGNLFIIICDAVFNANCKERTLTGLWPVRNGRKR
uniref:Uncharacterized protein n=1 Tax=Timema bartmani TaxID=61472 RepID=A0A7R9F9I8_9NEOP|nr:unnamed protein product [Timema bartmani]